MNKSAALSRLGLTGSEDSSGVMRAYGQQLAVTQERLVSAQTEADRQVHQTHLSELVEAYEFLTETGRYTKAPVDDASATVMRPEGDTPAVGASQDTLVRMETGAVLSSRLEIGALLGSGGMGNVYAARDRLKNEDVAIKVLRQDLLFSTAAKERFLAEAKLSCNLSHPNIVRVYDVGLSGNFYYFSMERLQGHTLRQRMEAYADNKRDFTVAEVNDIAHQLIDALRYAHRYIVHRDLKPENIWLSEDGTVKLMDFGIARAYSSSQLTQTGMTLGTAYYMAPEQRVAAKEVDWRADQYALGVVLYELLSGTIPMGAVKPLDKLRRDLPKRYADALMRAMSPKPEDRWPSLNDLLAEMDAPARKPVSTAAVALLGLGLAAVAAGGVYFMKQPDQIAATDTLQPAGKVLPPAEKSAPESGNGGVPPAGGPPVEADPQPAAAAPLVVEDAAPAAAVPVTPEPQPAATEPSPKAPAPAPIRVVKVDDSKNTRRAECLAQCGRDEGECRSINRRGRQECMRAVGFGGTGRLNAGTTTSPAAAQCVYYGQGRCDHSYNREACLARMSSRYNECVSVVGGSVASRRQDCEDKSRDADKLCLDDLRDCRATCE